MDKRYKATKVAYDAVSGLEITPMRPFAAYNLKLQEVAELTQTDPTDITWAIEEFGHFTTMTDGDVDVDWKVEEME